MKKKKKKQPKKWEKKRFAKMFCKYCTKWLPRKSCFCRMDFYARTHNASFYIFFLVLCATVFWFKFDNKQWKNSIIAYNQNWKCEHRCAQTVRMHAQAHSTYQTGINQFDRPLSCPKMSSIFALSQHRNSCRRFFCYIFKFYTFAPQLAGEKKNKCRSNRTLSPLFYSQFQSIRVCEAIYFRRGRIVCA